MQTKISGEFGKVKLAMRYLTGLVPILLLLFIKLLNFNKNTIKFADIVPQTSLFVTFTVQLLNS